MIKSTIFCIFLSFICFSSFAHLGYLYGDKQVKVYMGEGWHLDFHHTHFDQYSPPDFFIRVS
jgi:hypothetical protein